jgi:hypothetical protein
MLFQAAEISTLQKVMLYKSKLYKNKILYWDI